jgi:2-amino-4-hydroxy-6-hydroxymethyldihydropteridine diphosphokinase
MLVRSALSEAPVLIGLGANLGDPPAQLARAVRRLGRVVRLAAVSSLYRSAPVGFRDQPDFFNLVCVGATALAPLELLAATQAMEQEMGREPTFRNGPRPIDVDLLDVGGLVLSTTVLTLPHPGIPRRGFVLHPLAEMAPAWRHPVLDRTARELLLSAPELERVERWGPPPALP